MNHITPQENFWAGQFGDEYIGRNQGSDLLASNLSFFSKMLNAVERLNSCIEFGANIGMNLKALSLLFPRMKMSAIEINTAACGELKKFLPSQNIHNMSIFDYNSEDKFDLSFIKGVLIHLNPDMLEVVYKKLYNSTSKYILVAEYYNPTPVTIPYRGHSDRLFKRDFAGELLDRFTDLKLVDYGFVYRRDPKFPQDDITWFLLQKQ